MQPGLDYRLPPRGIDVPWHAGMASPATAGGATIPELRLRARSHPPHGMADLSPWKVWRHASAMHVSHGKTWPPCLLSEVLSEILSEIYFPIQSQQDGLDVAVPRHCECFAVSSSRTGTGRRDRPPQHVMAPATLH